MNVTRLAGLETELIRTAVSALAFGASVAFCDPAAAAKKKTFISPEILVLGDSQLSFGSGRLMLDFFNNYDRHCKRYVDDMEVRKRVGKMRTSMLGTRSTSLQSWVTSKGPAWRRMCQKDKTWGVNCSVWGHNSTPKRLYYQIGEGRNYQFCKRGKTPLQAMLRDDYYTPELLFFYLIGNGANRLATNPKAARDDVRRLVAQLPPDQKCIFMTTAPIHTPRRNRVRVKAEKNLQKAFAEYGKRCTFVAALTPRSVSFIQGKRKYFRQNKRGKVKDPFHPDEQATRKFLSVIKPKLCRAVAKELRMRPMALNGQATGKIPSGAPQMQKREGAGAPAPDPTPASTHDSTGGATQSDRSQPPSPKPVTHSIQEDTTMTTATAMPPRVRGFR